MADKHFLDYDGLSQFFSGLKQKFYQKPSSGIPKSDLASSVRESLDKADNALPKSGGTMTGAINMGATSVTRKKITMLADPTVDYDAANKKYVDDAIKDIGTELKDGSVTTAKIADSAVTEDKIKDRAVTEDKIATGAVTMTKIDNGAVHAGQIAAAAVTTAKIADTAVTTAKIDTGAVTTEKITGGAVTEDKIANGAVSSDKLGLWSVITDKINNSAVTTAKIDDNAVTSAKIYDRAVTEDKIATGAVTMTKIANKAVHAGQIADGAVTNAKIYDSAVTTAKIEDGAVASDKLENGSVITAKIANDAVTTEKIADKAVTTAKIDDSAVTTAKINDNAVTTAKIDDTAITTVKIADEAVTTAKIDDSAITTVKIADEAVTTAKIYDSAVIKEKIADRAVTEAKIDTGAVTTTKIANKAVNTAQIEDGAVTNFKIYDDAVRTEKIADGAVTSDKIALGAVTTFKMEDSAVSTAKIKNEAVTAEKLSPQAVTLEKLEGSIQRKVENAYEMSVDGIPEEDLSAELQNKINGLGGWVQMVNVAYGIDSYNHIVDLKENLKKVCICAYDSRTYILNYLGADKAQFVSNFNGSIYYVECSNANVWSASSAPISEADILVCRYGVTTLAQIQEAQRNSKLAVCSVGNIEYVLTSISTTEAQFTSVSYDDEMLYLLTCDANGWTSSSKSISAKDPIVENAKTNGGIGWTAKQDIVNARKDDQFDMDKFPTLDGTSIKPNTQYQVSYRVLAQIVAPDYSRGVGIVTSDANGYITLPECYNYFYGVTYPSLGIIRNTTGHVGETVTLDCDKDWWEGVGGSAGDYIYIGLTENVVHTIDEKFLPPELKEDLESLDGRVTYLEEHGGGGESYDDAELRQRIGAIESKESGWNAKQDAITDLASIRSGADLGATALQSVPNTYRTASEQDAIDNGKQDKLIAGANITIAADGKTISATGGGGEPINTHRYEITSLYEDTTLWIDYFEFGGTFQYSDLLNIFNNGLLYSIRVEDPESGSYTYLILDYSDVYGQIYGHFFVGSTMRFFKTKEDGIREIQTQR